MIETLITTLITAVCGAIAAIWSYWTGRKKTASDNAIKKVEALNALEGTIGQQCERISELHKLVLELKEENSALMERNANLERSVDKLTAEVESLRRELAQYKTPQRKTHA